MTYLTDMTAAELAAYYNQLAGTAIKPGSYTKAAWIAKVTKIEADILAAAPEEEEEVASQEHEDMLDQEMIDSYGRDTCPHCGVHLSNGVGFHGDEVNGKIIEHNTHEFACLACNGEFGDPIKQHAPTDITFEGPTFTLIQVATALGMTGKAARAKYRRYENDHVSTRYSFENTPREIARVVSVLKGKRG